MASNVQYWVRTGCTRQGIATAAVRLVAEFAFDDLDLENSSSISRSRTWRAGVSPNGPRPHCIVRSLLMHLSLHNLGAIATSSYCAGQRLLHVRDVACAECTSWKAEYVSSMTSTKRGAMATLT